MFAWPVINLSAKHDIYHTKIYSPSDKIKISFNSYYTMKMFTFSYMNFVHELVHELFYYRPQRSWAKVMFLQASVILSTGECLPQCMLGYHPPGSGHPLGADTPPGANTPRDQTSPGGRHPPPGADTPPGTRHPLPGADTPPGTTPPPQEADSGIWSTSGRYASYWNAFMFAMQLRWGLWRKEGNRIVVLSSMVKYLKTTFIFEVRRLST